MLNASIPSKFKQKKPQIHLFSFFCNVLWTCLSFRQFSFSILRVQFLFDNRFFSPSYRVSFVNLFQVVIIEKLSNVCVVLFFHSFSVSLSRSIL